MSVVYGNPVIDRRIVDVYSNYYQLDSNVPFTKDTTVTEIEFYAKAALPIQFIVYRPTGANLKYTVVDKTPLVTPTTGVYTYKLATPMQAAKGDVLGWYVQKTGVIAFDYDGSGKSSYTQIGGGITSFTHNHGRYYSVRVVEHAPPPLEEVKIRITRAKFDHPCGSPAPFKLTVGDVSKDIHFGRIGESFEFTLETPGAVATPITLEATSRDQPWNGSLIKCVEVFKDGAWVQVGPENVWCEGTTPPKDEAQYRGYPYAAIQTYE